MDMLAEVDEDEQRNPELYQTPRKSRDRSKLTEEQMRLLDNGEKTPEEIRQVWIDSGFSQEHPNVQAMFASAKEYQRSSYAQVQMKKRQGAPKWETYPFPRDNWVVQTLFRVNVCAYMESVCYGSLLT
jgi:hypothetical protein